MKCEKCGNSIPDNSLMCPYCKKAVKREVEEDNNADVYCECGQRLETDWEECPNCGKSTIPNNEKIWVDLLFLTVFLGSILYGFMVDFKGFAIAVIAIIIAKIVHPKSDLIDIMFRITMIIASFLSFILMFFLSVCGF